MFVSQDEICRKCREERINQFPDSVEKEKVDNGEFSPFFEGFSSFEDKESDRFVDFLIISESIGKLSKEDLSNMRKGSIQQISRDYYLKDALETFNQWKIRQILEFILEIGKTFYFTDVVKCFVKKDKGNKNFERAANYCAENYLKKQIVRLRPRFVILCGRRAEKVFFEKLTNEGRARLKHGENITRNGMKTIYSEFPSARNADRFVKEGEVAKLKESIRLCVN